MCAISITKPDSYYHLGSQMGLSESLFVKIHWVLIVKQQSQHWPDRRGFVSDQSDQNEEIQGARKVLQNRTHIHMSALRGVAGRAFLLKSIGF